MLQALVALVRWQVVPASLSTFRSHAAAVWAVVWDDLQPVELEGCGWLLRAVAPEGGL